VARSRRLDVIHGYEWPPCLDAYFGAHAVLGVPIVCTVLSMEVSPLVPDSIPLIMGTERLGAEARENRGDVRVLEPPIDVDADHPGIDGLGFRAEHGVAADDLLIVTVSRLSIELKLDALVDVTVGVLAATLAVRLIVVGDGDARSHLEKRAAAVNERYGRLVVSLVGSMSDPRPAYAAADIVVGMGSSALRAMAIGKPLIVQGEGGFSLPFTPENLPTFLWQGFWGEGDGASGSSMLAEQLEPLVTDAGRRTELGNYGREVVVDRFSLRRAADIMEGIYGDVTAGGSQRPSIAEMTLIAGRAASREVDQHRPSTKRQRVSHDRGRLAAAAEEDETLP
jgi:glycosyltransferase involved in cell wall biosynthesis